MGAARVILALSLPGGYALPIGMCVLLMILVFIALYLLSLARAQSERELRALLRRDPRLYIERLENNRRLKLVFRPAVLLLYKLEGYMSLNDDGKCRELIAKLDGMKLQPRDRLQFYQTKLSFYAYAGDGEQAKATLTQLEDFLHKSGADEVDQYKKLLHQARQIVAVYVDAPEAPASGRRDEGRSRPGAAAISHRKALALCRERGSGRGLSEPRS